jgi:uroporphyrin-III C-methyltransferase
MTRNVFSYHKAPRLSLVGAGPGDPELITMKAIRTLQTADIVLYDSLVGKEILNYIPIGTPALSVGKRAGLHSYSQEEINDLIVELALLYGHVVRLKGGDPYVFGRGGEEVEVAIRNGIEVAVIPGITSAIAAPASINIPVTCRGLSESFWIVTGTTMAGAISDDIALAAQSSATVVILMGMSKLEEIMETFRFQGKAQTPVAIIQNATLDNERYVVGTVDNIVRVARAWDIGSPAVIVVGEVVRCSELVQNIQARTNINFQYQ